MKKINIVFFSANRAEYSLIEPFLKIFSSNRKFNVGLVVAGSHLEKKFGNTFNEIKKDNIKVLAKIKIPLKTNSLIDSSEYSNLLQKEINKELKKIKTDIIFLSSDRFETFAFVVSAYLRKIPIIHYEGGDVTEGGALDDNLRHAITKLSHLHFPSTKRSSQFLINMGEDPKKIFNVGCPSMDIINFKNLKNKNFNLNKFGVGHIINIKNPYIVVLFHPDTTEILKLENQIDVLIKSVYEFSEENNSQVVWFWPNIDAGSDKISSYLRKFREKFPNQKIRFIVNLEPEDYLKVINECKVIVGNSSSGIREASFMGIPSVNVGLRQNNREKYLNVKDSDFDVKKLKKFILLQFKKGRYKKSNLYGTGNAGKKIIDILGKVDLSIKKELNYLKKY